MLRTLLINTLLLSSVISLCPKHDIETVLGGMENSALNVLSMTFDVEPTTLDMVVGATLRTRLSMDPFDVPLDRMFLYFL